jgi:hypothetical protein
MSQITERKNAIEVRGISWREYQTDIASRFAAPVVSSKCSILPEILCSCPVDIFNLARPLISAVTINDDDGMLQNPLCMKDSFEAKRESKYKQFVKEGHKPLAAKKAAIIQALSETDFIVSPSSVITDCFKNVIQANNEQSMEQAFKRGIRELQHAHAETFVQAMANVCRKASVQSGFSDVSMKLMPASQGIVVTALNEKGQGLVTEIALDRWQEINTTTEVIGIHDGSCGKVMSMFNDSLKKFGVKFGSEKTRSSLNCPVNNSQKNRALERVRKLNQPIRQRN